MSELTDIVDVIIDAQTTGVTRTGFGTPMIMSAEAQFANLFPETARIYTSIADMGTDGFSTSGPTYKAANAFFSQNPVVSQVVIGKRATLPTQTIDIEVTAAVEDAIYTITINGVAHSYTSLPAGSVGDIATGLAAAIDGGAQNVTASTPAGGVFNITGATSTGGATIAGETFTLSANQRGSMTVQNVTADPGIAADLTTIRTAVDGNDDWYMLSLDTGGEAEILALAAAVEGFGNSGAKIFGATTSDSDVLAAPTTGVAGILQGLAYKRTFLTWNHDALATHASNAIAGTVLPYDPGFATWWYQSPAGVSSSGLTSNELANLQSKNCGYISSIAGQNASRYVQASGGQFMDVTRTIDWLAARYREGIFSLLLNSPKVPYTSAGKDAVENVIRGVNNEGISNGAIANDPAPTYSSPNISDISTTDRANRLLPDMKTTVRLAGAFHSVEVRATVTV